MVKARIGAITKDVLKRARERGDAAYARGAASAHLDGERLMIVMRNGAIAGVDIGGDSVQASRDGSSRKTRTRRNSRPFGDYVWFPQLDDGYSVPALLDLSFGAAIRSRLGKLGGPKSSPAKAAAARKNGKKGGFRPLKGSESGE